MDRSYVDYQVEDNVGIITLDRPEAANAQSERVLSQLDEAWRAADHDRDVKVIVMRSTGKHFSAGHDMNDVDLSIDRSIPLPDALLDWESRGYLRYAKSWRTIPKPSIAAVQGKCISGGLMLCWPCDLIVAADDAEFSDPVVYMGICGVEFHAHTWELGARRAKELLFTGGSISAQEAHAIGMVNRVVPRADLESETLALARQIARQDSFALRMAKEAVNHTLDVQGFGAAIDSGFMLHHLGHMRATVVTGGTPALVDLAKMKTKASE